MEIETEQNRKILGIICNTMDDFSTSNQSASKPTVSKEQVTEIDVDDTKENEEKATIMSEKSVIGNRIPPMKNPSSKLRPPKHTSKKPSMTDLEKKYIPVTSSGYGKIRPNTIPRSSSASSVQRMKHIHDESSRSSSALRSNTRSSSSTRASSTSRSRRIHSAPCSPAKPYQPNKSTTLRSNSSSRVRPRLDSDPKFKGSGKNTSGTTTGSLWKQEQRKMQMRRKQQQQEKNPPQGIAHKRSNSDRTLSYVEALQSPQKSIKTCAQATPSSPKGNDNSKSSTPTNVTNAGYAKTTLDATMNSIKQVLKSISPKNAKNNRENRTTPSISPAHSWSKALDFGSVSSDYFDRRKVTLTTELTSLESPSEKSSEFKRLDEQIFAHGTGLAEEEIRKILIAKIPSTKQYDYKKKFDSCATMVKKLRETLNSYMQAKQKLVHEAIEKEIRAKATRNRVIQKAQLYEEENAIFKTKLKKAESNQLSLNEKYRDKERELLQTLEKVSTMDDEVELLKVKLKEIEHARTQAEINLAVTEGRCKEASKQADSWRSELATIEASKSEAVKKVESSMERELIELREECAALRTRMESREEELGRLININSSGDDCTTTQLGGVKREFDRLRERVNELESLVVLKDSEIERVTAEKDTAISRSNAKDSDMSELMKGLRDIQRSGQEREERANNLRMAAEDKAAELEVLLTETKGENSVMVHEKNTLKEHLEKCRADILSLEQTISCLKEDIQNYKEEHNSKDTTLQVERELRLRAEAKEKEERNERVAISAQMVAMTKEHAQVEAHLKEINDSQSRQWEDKLGVSKEICQGKDEELKKMNETITSLEGERNSLMDALSAKKSMADAKNVEEIGRLNGEINVLNKRLAEAEQRATSFGLLSAEQIKSLQDQLREGQAERRKMHNIIQELRGNVRVFARVRPFLSEDGENNDEEPCVVPKNENSLKILLKGDSPQEQHFSFDRVFAPSVGQDTVFQEVSEFIQSALDGYNVCLFSYGQTGSGKTHTMQGTGVGQMRGIIPRAIEQVGKYKETLEKEGWKYEMKVSFLEIYNEKIKDLLRENESNETKHDIKVKSDGQRYVTDLTVKQLEPTDCEALQELMRYAAKYRSVASTNMNAVSSRSHSVFTLHLTAVHSKQKQTLRGTLNLVDLAGSERLNRSGATGDRAKEAMSINKSLSSLTDVFTSIGKKASHIPFRNSKLTYLLQPSLSGDGKTLMMVNLSPTSTSYHESLCSLRFASQVNKCELGKPRRSIEDVDSDSETTKSRKIVPPSPSRIGTFNKHILPVKSPQRFTKRKKTELA